MFFRALKVIVNKGRDVLAVKHRKHEALDFQRIWIMLIFRIFKLNSFGFVYRPKTATVMHFKDDWILIQVQKAHIFK